jgi:hypothetical protein
VDSRRERGVCRLEDLCTNEVIDRFRFGIGRRQLEKTMKDQISGDPRSSLL